MDGNCKLKIGNCKLQICGCPRWGARGTLSRLLHFSIYNLQFAVFNSCLLLVALFMASGPASARAVDTDALRRKQDAQERARDMARQLVSGILEVQLQQLEENGLKDLPVYREIAGMKKNIGALVEKEMEKAVALLVKAQRGTESEREENFRQARQMIRNKEIHVAEIEKMLKKRGDA